MNVSYYITITIVIINRVKYYKKFTKCVIGDKKESFGKHTEMVWTEKKRDYLADRGKEFLRRKYYRERKTTKWFGYINKCMKCWKMKGVSVKLETAPGDKLGRWTLESCATISIPFLKQFLTYAFV